MYAIRSYYVALSTQKLMAGGLDDLVSFEKNEAGFVLSDEGQTASIRITSYNVCYTKLLRMQLLIR